MASLLVATDADDDVFPAPVLVADEVGATAGVVVDGAGATAEAVAGGSIELCAELEPALDAADLDDVSGVGIALGVSVALDFDVAEGVVLIGMVGTSSSLERPLT